jgi:hypothetical protein
MAAFLVELFPARIRTPSLSPPYHLGVGILGGILAFLASARGLYAGNVFAGLCYPVGIAAMTAIVALIFLPETGGAVQSIRIAAFPGTPMNKIASWPSLSLLAMILAAPAYTATVIDNERVTVWDVPLTVSTSGPMTPHDNDAVILFLEGGQVEPSIAAARPALRPAISATRFMCRRAPMPPIPLSRAVLRMRW